MQIACGARRYSCNPCALLKLSRLIKLLIIIGRLFYIREQQLREQASATSEQIEEATERSEKAIRKAERRAAKAERKARKAAERAQQEGDTASVVRAAADLLAVRY